jgi:hypothetical protein
VVYLFRENEDALQVWVRHPPGELPDVPWSEPRPEETSKEVAIRIVREQAGLEVEAERFQESGTHRTREWMSVDWSLTLSEPEAEIVGRAQEGEDPGRWMNMKRR